LHIDQRWTIVVAVEESSDKTSAGAIAAGLARMGLWRDASAPPMQPLTGGVSSDIWRVDLPGGPICVKRALARLKVAQVWEAPVERNASEWHWLQAVAAIAPGAVPQPIAEDRAGGMFAMAYLEPSAHPVWKTQLRDGIAEPTTARAVGTTLATIHAATAGRADIARTFATDAIFEAIRLEPYLRATARRHSDLAAALNAAADTTSRRRSTRPPTPRRAPSLRWCTATSARRTSWSARAARSCSTPNAPGTAIPRSTSRSA
jgi:hypothetical protein